MTDTIAPMHLYKLVTGESVIGFFFGEHEVGSLSARHHFVTKPRAVNEYYELNPWFIGLKDDQESVMIPLSAIIAIAEQDVIDEVLLENYLLDMSLSNE